MLRTGKLLVLLLALLLGLLIRHRNEQVVHIDYYVGTLEMAVSSLLFGAVGIGVVLGALVSLTLVLPAKREARRLRKAQALAEQEVNKLRGLTGGNAGTE